MPLPQTLNVTALRQVARFVSGADRDKGRLVLAAYDLAGFGLAQLVGNPAYVSDAMPPPAVVMTEAEHAEFATATGDRLKELFEKALVAYGPQLLSLLLKLLSK